MAATLEQEPEKREAEELSAPTSRVVYAAVSKDGEEAFSRPSSTLFFSALAAGMSMSFSMIAEGILTSALPDEQWRPLVAKLGYCVGFVIVILGRQQLYTESTLSPMLPVLRRSHEASVAGLARIWAIVLVANLLGAVIVAWTIASTNAFEPEVRAAFGEMGRKAMEPGFGSVLLRGIFAGWLIALMVWLLPFAESARVLVIIVITYVVGVGNFSHVVAGSTEVFALAAAGGESWGAVLAGYTLPALIGNTIGGVILVALLSHAQVNPNEKG